jgi:hypothetical protein
VRSAEAAAVINRIFFFSRATLCTASATDVSGTSAIASTPSTSNQRRAIDDATSGLFCMSAATISIGLPSALPP